MRTLRLRSIIPLPDMYFITGDQFRLALGRSSYVWRKVDLPVFLDYFPPVALGSDLPADYRWHRNTIAEQFPALVSHLGPGTWSDRYKQRKRTDTAAYIAQRAAEHSVKKTAAAA